MFVKQYCASKNLVVLEDQTLEGDFKKSMATTIPTQAGDKIASYLGNYRSRAPSKKKNTRLDTIYLRDVPGSSVFDCFSCHIVAIKVIFVCSVGSKGRKYITAHPRCPASYANDPNAAENTKHNEPNCAFVEDPLAAFDDEARVYLMCIKTIPVASVDNPVTLWVNYNEIEHTYNKKTNKEKVEGVLPPAAERGTTRVISPAKAKEKPQLDIPATNQR